MKETHGLPISNTEFTEISKEGNEDGDRFGTLKSLCALHVFFVNSVVKIYGLERPYGRMEMMESDVIIS